MNKTVGLRSRFISLLFALLFIVILLFSFTPFEQSKLDSAALLYSYPTKNVNVANEYVELNKDDVVIQHCVSNMDDPMFIDLITHDASSSASLNYSIVLNENTFALNKNNIVTNDDYLRLNISNLVTLKNGDPFSLIISNLNADPVTLPSVSTMSTDYNLIHNSIYKNECLGLRLVKKGSYTIYLIALITCVVCSLLFAFLSGKASAKTYLLFALLFGTMIVLLNSFPNSFESQDVIKASSIADGNLLQMQSNPLNPDIKGVWSSDSALTAFDLRSDSWEANNSDYSFYANTDAAVAVLPAHFVLAAPIWLSNVLALNHGTAVLLSRLFVFVLCAVMCAIAIHKAGRFAPVFYTVSVLPCCMFVFTSYSVASLCISAIILFISICLKYIYDTDCSVVSASEAVMLVVSYALFVSFHYFIFSLLIVLFFAIPSHAFGNHTRSLVSWLLALVFALCLALQVYLFVMFPERLQMLLSTLTTNINSAFADPLNLAKSVCNALPVYLSSVADSLTTQTIFSPFALLFLAVILFYSFMSCNTEELHDTIHEQSLPSRFFFVFVGLLFCLVSLIVPALLLPASPSLPAVSLTVLPVVILCCLIGLAFGHENEKTHYERNCVVCSNLLSTLLVFSLILRVFLA